MTRDSTGRCQAWLNGAYLSVAGAYKQIDNHNYTQGTSQIGAGTYYSGTFIGLITDVKIDNANLYSTWGPGNNGNIPVPTAPATPGYSTQLLLSAASNAAVFTNNALDVLHTDDRQ